MKKIVLYLLCAVAIGMTVACSTKHKAYHIGVAQNSDDAWHQQMNREMKREASFHKRNVELDFRSSPMDGQLQKAQIDSMLKKGIDLLVVSPCDSVLIDSQIQSIIKRGIPVVVLGQEVATKHYTTLIDFNNYELGRDIGSYVVHTLNGKGTIMELMGDVKGNAAQQRHDGLHDILKTAPNVKVIAQCRVGWEGPRLEAQLDSLFNTGIIPDIIIAPNDRTGVRINDFTKKRHLKHIDVIGVDGLNVPDGGLHNVEQGKLSATFVYQTGGDKAIQCAMQILQNEPYQRITALKPAIINATTMRVFRMQIDQMEEKDRRIVQMDSIIDKSLSKNAMQHMLLLASAIIIFLIGITLVIGIRAYYVSMHRNKILDHQKRKLEEQHKQLVSITHDLEKKTQELEESTRQKLSYFTEVSHDLRTPLTLISAPIEQLCNAPNLTPEQCSMLYMVKTNTHTLLRLVGQMLDFRKFEEGKLHLTPTRVRIDQALMGWCDSFRAIANKKLIRYKINFAQPSHPDLLRCTIDRSKMESVVYNLLSNAFKYTPEGGSIEVNAHIEAQTTPNEFVLVIQDTGKGIAAEKLPHIFEQFYQADVSHDGSGIGLAIVKIFVELHGGSIHVESMLGKGTRFTVRIPCTQPTTQEKPLVNEEENNENSPSIASTPVLPHADNVPVPNPNLPKVLIIDDNEDIRSYLTLLLKEKYEVTCAANGQEGLQKALRLVPDAIVCDVMMPEMNGWELCKHLKGNEHTAQIPVMLLTACSLDEQRIKGLECGADSYLSKPFSPEVFCVQLKSLIANRQRLRAYFNNKSMLITPNLESIDKDFMQQLLQCIGKGMHDFDFSVEKLAGIMGMDRTQLYRKVKSLTGTTPIELLRVERLKKAAELLTRTDLNVSQIAYEVGFTTPNYLTRCFKEYFNMTPIEYKERKKGVQ